MISAVPPSLLEANPLFAKLYTHLCSKVLDQDASTHSKNLGHDATATKLYHYHVQSAQNLVLMESLCEIVVADADDGHFKPIPQELQELVYNISMFLLSGPGLALDSDVGDLMICEVDLFHKHLPTIAESLSTLLQSKRTTMLKIAEAAPVSTEPSLSKIFGPPSLPSVLRSQLTQLSELRQFSIPAAEKRLNDTITELLRILTTQLSHLIPHLESHTCGVQSRHLTSRATHLSHLTQGMAAKAAVLNGQAQRDVYAPATAFGSALANYCAHLDREMHAARTRERVCCEELRMYEACDGKGGVAMREICRLYSEVLAEIAVVKEEIERLVQAKGQRESMKK